MLSRATFFGALEEDEALEAGNRVFWDSLLGHAKAELPPGFVVEGILDVGCHRGGLLELLARQWPPKRLCGIEPLGEARTFANERLRSLAPVVAILSPAEWSTISDRSIDLITSHEVIYLIPDLRPLFAEVHRVLSDKGVAFIVLGSHAENPLFAENARGMENLGHNVTAHHPLDILTTAADVGLKGFVQPLRTSGWIRPDPQGPLKYPTLSALMDHHYRQKLIFLFCRAETNVL